MARAQSILQSPSRRSNRLVEATKQASKQEVKFFVTIKVHPSEYQRVSHQIMSKPHLKRANPADSENELTSISDDFEMTEEDEEYLLIGTGEYHLVGIR